MIFDENKIFAKAETSIQLKNELDDMEIGRPYISFISNMSEYNDNGFVAKLSSETDKKGIIINTNYYEDEKAVAVKDAVIEYLGISLSQTKIISSIGLTTLPMDFSEDKILDYYQEYKSGNRYYLTDTDNDGLENFKEIAFDSKIIKFNPDLVLPTIAECRAYVIETENCVYVEKGWDRFIATEIPQTLQYILNNVRILPIKSDPLSSDGDEDGREDKKDNNPLIFYPIVDYDRDAAVSYAFEWHDLTRQKIDFNKKYDFYFYRLDCANFLSQCLNAGGYPMTGYGRESGWHSYRIDENSTSAEAYEVSASWSMADNLYNYFKNSDYSIKIVEITEQEAMDEFTLQSIIQSNSIQIGDMLMMDFESDGHIDHSTIINRVNHTLLYTAHSVNRYNHDFRLTYDDYSSCKIYVICLGE
jgi:hypothetical protein